jgi:hypothetical protein
MRPIETSVRNNTLHVIFQGALTLKHADTILNELRQAMTISYNQIHVTFANYQKMDISFLQIFVSFKNELRIRNIPLVLQGGFQADDNELLERLNMINLFPFDK